MTSNLDIRQKQREKLQRQAALGRRMGAAEDGSFGPIIKRWINASVKPVSTRLQTAASFYSARDYPAFCSVLDSPLFELQAALDDGSGERTALNAIFYWLNRGEGQYADDLVLAALGTAISGLAKSTLKYTAERGRKQHMDGDGVFLTATLSAMADAARETALGQFLTQVQGAEAMERVRQKDRASWAQRNRIDAIAAMLFGQVLPQLVSEERGEVVLDKVGTRSILKVLTQKDDKLLERRISLRKPQKEDWELLEVARKTKGEADPHKRAWMTFALAVLCAAQAEHGWFDLGKRRKQGKQRGNRWQAWMLHFADDPTNALSHDLERWLQMGFSNDPMIVEPEHGDYLTVKHKQVVGRRGPMGCATAAEGTQAWETACNVMANTAWQVNAETLKAINTGPLWEAALKSQGGHEDTLRNVLGAYAREASEEAIYMPLYMDFRGRVYPRTTWVTYQGTDVQKGLLKFPQVRWYDELPKSDAFVMHLTNLYGNGLDKAPLSERQRWFSDYFTCSMDDPQPEEVIQFESAVTLSMSGQLDSIPCQIDGTCNGLQHLSALFRDELAAPNVNLTGSSYEDRPSDLYQTVADVVLDMMARPVGTIEAADNWAHTRTPNTNPNWKWISRSIGNYEINRKLCKKPVMVLPYGGTFDAIEKAVVDSVLDQKPDPSIWQECKVRVPFSGMVVDDQAVHAGYLAFKDRELADHPLFKDDMKKLSQYVFEAIKKSIPRAMAAMDAFRQIAGKVGDRSLEWSTGFGSNPLWVVHAYPMSARSSLSLKGFHLPNSIRGLSLLNGKDEVDPRAHRTGIVANFIHSQDASHLARTMKMFREDGGTSFGAVHDCFMGRPSEMGTLNSATRVSFAEQYTNDPLKQPVRLRDVHSGKVEEFQDWFLMAAHLGVSFPDYGKWEPLEVLKSAWFFS